MTSSTVSSLAQMGRLLLLFPGPLLTDGKSLLGMTSTRSEWQNTTLEQVQRKILKRRDRELWGMYALQSWTHRRCCEDSERADLWPVSSLFRSCVCPPVS